MDLHGERQDVLVLAPVGRGVVQHARAGAGGIEDEAAAVAPVETQRREVETVRRTLRKPPLPFQSAARVGRRVVIRLARRLQGTGAAERATSARMVPTISARSWSRASALESEAGERSGPFPATPARNVACCERQAFRSDVGRGRTGAGCPSSSRKPRALRTNPSGVDQQVGRGAIGCGRKADRQHRGAPIPAPQLAQHRGEVGVGREHDEPS